MRVSGRQLTVIRRKDLFHQDGSVRELSGLPVILSRSRRRVGVVQLVVVFQIDDFERSERLVEVSIAWRLADVSGLVDEIESAVAAGGLRSRLLIGGKDDERDGDQHDA